MMSPCDDYLSPPGETEDLIDVASLNLSSDQERPTQAVPIIEVDLTTSPSPEPHYTRIFVGRFTLRRDEAMTRRKLHAREWSAAQRSAPPNGARGNPVLISQAGSSSTFVNGLSIANMQMRINMHRLLRRRRYPDKHYKGRETCILYIINRAGRGTWITG